MIFLYDIIKSTPLDYHLKKIVLMLGSLHAFMNFLGAICTLMDGTSLKSFLAVMNGENALVHMLNVQAVTRAFRGNILMGNCLHQQLVQFILG